jgi:hypothetical protein
MEPSGSPFHPTPRRDSAMAVDAPMTPPTSPLPKEVATEQQQLLETPGVPSQGCPVLPSQVPPQVSLDQIMRLQQLRLNQDRKRKDDGTETLTDEDWQSTEMPRMPQRSLEDEEIHLQGSGALRLTDFDVVETLGACFA